ncbi:MAG: class I SAM-dependent methyltransferase, partial [Planctomycetota bacterium]
MSFKQLQRTWDTFGRQDPLWAILSHKDKRGNRWQLDDFMDTGRKEIQEVLDYARSLGQELPMHKALDFGCGVGRLTQALADHFQEVCGVDVAASMLDRARELNRQGERCTYHLNQATDLSLFPDGEFDFVYSNITLQHMRPELA